MILGLEDLLSLISSPQVGGAEANVEIGSSHYCWAVATITSFPSPGPNLFVTIMNNK
jgi:hypothetical protein